MIKEQLYRETTDILFQSYYNDTLRHGSCHTCAVGNIVAARNGYTISIIGDAHFWLKNGIPVHEPKWSKYCVTTETGQLTDPRALGFKSVRNEIASTGYTPQEIAMIEYAFESARNPNFGDEENMFLGLEAVLNTLALIHQVGDNRDVVSRFHTHYKTLVHH